MRLLDRYPNLLLDMNGTFMFHQDRFGCDADFWATCRELGGESLSPDDVTRYIRVCYESLCKLYEQPARYDDFPSLAESFLRFSDAPPSEIDLLVQVFTHHECGSVPSDHADFIRELSRTHRIALVANIWGPKTVWLEELAGAGLVDAFHTLVFSSDSRSMKPSARLFNAALSGLSSAPGEGLFIGDSLRCDMEGAKAVGLTTVWISRSRQPHPAVDYRIGELLRLGDLLV